MHNVDFDGSARVAECEVHGSSASAIIYDYYYYQYYNYIVSMQIIIAASETRAKIKPRTKWNLQYLWYHFTASTLASYIYSHQLYSTHNAEEGI